MFRRKVIEEPKEIKPKNNRDKIWYKVEVLPMDDYKEPYTFRVKTDDVEWTMKRHQRGKDPFTWKLI